MCVYVYVGGDIWGMRWICLRSAARPPAPTRSRGGAGPHRGGIRHPEILSQAKQRHSYCELIFLCCVRVGFFLPSLFPSAFILSCLFFCLPFCLPFCLLFYLSSFLHLLRTSQMLYFTYIILLLLIGILNSLEKSKVYMYK